MESWPQGPLWKGWMEKLEGGVGGSEWREDMGEIFHMEVERIARVRLTAGESEDELNSDGRMR